MLYNYLFTGSTVEVLINSGVGSYVEFKTIEGLFMQPFEESALRLFRVPCSKSDIFKVVAGLMRVQYNCT